jgi:hypothetical protein
MMTVTKFFLYLALMLWLVSGVVACAPKSQGIVRAQRSYDEVFQASLAAVQEAEFTVTSQDREKGAIVAVKRLPTAAGDTMRMTVRINQAPTGLTVVTTVVQPSVTPVTGEKPCKCHVKRFVSALENRLPDVQVVSIE